MASKTPAEIEALIRFRGDFRSTQRFPAADIQREIQASWTELYELITDVNEGYFDTTATTATVADVAFVATPADAWRVRAVDLILADGSVLELERVGIGDRNRFRFTTGAPVAFRLTARGIDLYPTPDAAYTLRVTYTPTAPVLFGAQFVAASDVTFAIVGGVTVLTAAAPPGAVPGDQLVFVVATNSASGPPPAATLPDGWAIATTGSTAGNKNVTVLRRAVAAADTTHAIPLGATVTAAGGALLAYRNIDSALAAIAASAVDVAASTSYPCPSVTLVAATDLYIGVAWDLDDDPQIAPPITAASRFSAAQTLTTSRRLLVFDLAPGLSGATGTQTATANTANAGVAASFGLRVGAPREYYNGWEEYVIYATLVRLTANEERDTGVWQGQLDRARARITGGAGGRNSASPQLIPLMDDY